LPDAGSGKITGPLLRGTTTMWAATRETLTWSPKEQAGAEAFGQGVFTTLFLTGSPVVF
jgi:hypothetical protein